ncbi:homeodomain-interacting protein kinase 1-like [Eucyclogobius newberryi]|uniref:homeodomain-interacting protein kinase 1-like n=1 Tax=Eucyclogobius newberryi TaxID=166745 RepID=UPI003B5A3885
MLKSFTFPTAPSECVEPVSTGSSLVSKTACYNIVSLLGRGAFGNVVKCVRISDMKTVAVKMIKNEEPYNLCVKHEYAALSMLKQLDQDKCNIVRWNHIFMDKGYICLEFERLHTSLHDFMGARVKPLSLCEIRPIIQQVAIALLHLQGIGLMHADLKLENIMLVNHPKDPYKVKVIDFGLAVKLSDATVGTYTQSRYYRSPEVLLGLPLTTAIDVWSLGCVTAYLYLGWPLHCGSTEYNMLQSIVETHGALPKNMIQKGVKTSTFFWWNVKTKCWTFKNPEQYQKDSKKEQIPEDLRKIRFPNLDALINVSISVAHSVKV